MVANTDLLSRIDAASRDEVLEAARFFAQKVVKGSAELATAKALAQELAVDPFAYVSELEELARATLVAGAKDTELAADVERALDGAARKHFVLGGTEVVALAALGVIALKVIVTKGKGPTGRERTITIQDGKIVIVEKEKTEPISITEDLSAMFRGLFGRKAGK